MADVTTDHPAMLFTDADGVAAVRAQILVGTDGSRSALPQGGAGKRTPAIFPGVSFRVVRDPVRGAADAPELIYSHSDDGFALISQRTDTLQRMYSM